MARCVERQEWKLYLEIGTLVWLAEHLDLSVVRFDYPFHQCQPETCAAAVAASRRIAPKQAIKDERQVLFGDSYAFVANADSHFAPLSFHGHLDSAPIPGVFDCVVEQIKHGTAQPQVVPLDHGIA